MQLTKPQSEIFLSKARFVAVVAGKPKQMVFAFSLPLFSKLWFQVLSRSVQRKNENHLPAKVKSQTRASSFASSFFFKYLVVVINGKKGSELA